MEENGWLQEQFEAVEKSVNAWPDWLKRAIGIKGLHNLDNVCNDFVKQCEIFAEKLAVETGVPAENADQIKKDIIVHLSRSVVAIKYAILKQEAILAFEEIPCPKNPYKPGPMFFEPD